jgi:hypothetical protein
VFALNNDSETVSRIRHRYCIFDHSSTTKCWMRSLPILVFTWTKSFSVSVFHASQCSATNVGPQPYFTYHHPAQQQTSLLGIPVVTNFSVSVLFFRSRASPPHCGQFITPITLLQVVAGTNKLHQIALLIPPRPKTPHTISGACCCCHGWCKELRSKGTRITTT